MRIPGALSRPVLSYLQNRHKSSHHAPAGLLQPLSVPRRPWSHVSLDFVTVTGHGLKLELPLLRSSDRYTEAANHRCSQAPTYLVGQRVWLSTQDLPLRVESKKLTPKFIDPFEIQRIINPVAIRLKLPSIHARPSHLPCLQDQTGLQEFSLSSHSPPRRHAPHH
ncbi:hypothetical protein L3Q82_001376 [Scortum barcoo]|uniref:Uncharacterized protein n=1 Tax=Scortum barcoo TaxID=214431 RepID=A0ACB8W7W7_9TELE|nr:hypothetical protein L3Q82_001376 [Scortum barcoo]